MKTITAKELRDNLEKIGRQVNLGQHIGVTYRSRPIFTLVPPDVATKKSGKKMRGLDILLASPRVDSGLDPNMSIKELYHKHLDEKHNAE